MVMLEQICEYDISATNTIPFPIELVYFKGEKNKEYNKIEWETYSEINNDYFTLQKVMMVLIG